MGARLGRRAGLALALAAVPFTAFACGFARPPEKAPCEWMRTDATPAASEGRLAVLIDTSNSTRSATLRSGAPDYVAALREVVERAVGDLDRVSIGAFSGSPGVDWVAKDLSTNPRKNNERNQEHRRRQAVECLNEELVKTATRAPVDAGTDVLTAVRDAAAWVRESAGEKRIVVATDGFATKGCASLTGARLADDNEIDSIAQVCLDRKELSSALLSGVSFSMVGVGRSAPDHPSVTPAQMDWLARLWEQLCVAAGAKDRCDIRTESVAASGEDGGTTARSSTEITDPVVSFDALRTYRVPSAALFNTEEASILPDSVALLKRIAVDIRTIPGVRVVVEGHADSRGSPAENEVLSQKRADAVMALLVDNGVRNVTADGKGETQPLCKNEFQNGQTNDACLQQNRRVEIIVTPSDDR